MGKRTTRRHVLRGLGTTAAGAGLLRRTTHVARSQEAERWAQFGYDSANTGYAPENTAPGITDSSEVQFELNFEEAADPRSPAVVNGTVYVGSSENLHAIDAKSGDQLWAFTVNWRLSSDPAVADGTVYISDWDGHLYALDTASGSEKWSSSAGGKRETSPVVANGTVYSGERGFDAETGEQQWVFKRFPEAEVTYSSNTTAAVSGGTVYLGYEILDGFRDDKNTLYAADAETGEQQWGYATEREIESAPAVGDGTVYVGSNDGVLHAVDAETGTEQWSFQMEGNRVIASPAVANGTVYAGTDTSPLYAIDAESGEQQWASKSPNVRVEGSPAVAGGTVYVGLLDGLCAFDATTGELNWNWSSLGSFSSPAIVDGTVYAGGDIGRVAGLARAVPTTTPTETTTPLPTAVPTTRIEQQSGGQNESTSAPTDTPTPSFFNRFGNALSVLLILVGGGILLTLGKIYRKFGPDDEG